jgi:hypothetical protein
MIWRINATVVSACGERATFFAKADTPSPPIVGDRVWLVLALETTVSSRQWSFFEQREPILDCWCLPIENVERKLLLEWIFAAVERGLSVYDLTPGIEADTKNDARAIRR